MNRQPAMDKGFVLGMEELRALAGGGAVELPPGTTCVRLGAVARSLLAHADWRAPAVEGVLAAWEADRRAFHRARRALAAVRDLAGSEVDVAEKAASSG